MNEIIILGNGFDLAHNLKTSYSDFILWYLIKAVTIFNKSGIYQDKLLSLKHPNNAVRYKFPAFSMISTEELVKELERSDYQAHFKSDFLNKIVRRNIETNWVDIENEYYDSLQSCIDYKIRTGETTKFKDQIGSLNLAMETLQNELQTYLSMQVRNREIELQKQILDHIRKIRANTSKFQLLILNFNYTSTIDVYLQKMVFANLIRINIHGSIDDESNPIIFGYGDEMDKNYSRIEDLEDDDALSFIKSFSYFKTDNLNKLNDFLNGGKYDVNIMGHSCGRSDRLLLNRIFENDNCHKIKIFYHKKDENRSDYIYKTMALSRLFQNKTMMRDKVLNINNCTPLAYVNHLEMSSVTV